MLFVWSFVGWEVIMYFVVEFCWFVYDMLCLVGIVVVVVGFLYLLVVVVSVMVFGFFVGVLGVLFVELIVGGIGGYV